MFAQLAARAAEAERERLLESLSVMNPAEVALILRQAEQSADPLVGALGFAVSGASDEALQQQVLDAVGAGDDGTVAAVGELFPDADADYDDYDEGDEGDDYGVEDAWAAKRRS